MEKFIPQCPFTVDAKELSQMNALVLAFIGDGVQTLYVRTKLAVSLREKTGELHKKAVPQLKASGQSDAVKKILPMLTEEELSLFRRARNAKPASMAKNAKISDYHMATGFEAVIGYLYLSGQTERLEALMECAFLPDSTNLGGNQ